MNLSHNALHTVAQSAFLLPSLVSLDMSHNSLFEASYFMFDTSPKLKNIYLSNNSISILQGEVTICHSLLQHVFDTQSFSNIGKYFSEETFSLLSRMESLDFSHNSIMKIAADTFVGMEVGILNLAHNSLRKVPRLALKKLTRVTELVLDRNLFTSLEEGDIHNVKGSPSNKL